MSGGISRDGIRSGAAGAQQPGTQQPSTQQPGTQQPDAQQPGTAAGALVTHGLTKRYGAVAALDDVSLHVPQGARFGLLGPNGSGKTTLVRIVLGLVYATSGTVELLGEPMPKRAAQVLPRVGALVEGPGAYAHLSARANLSLLDAAGPGSRRGRADRVAQALRTVGLDGVGRRKVKAYSLGMRQRLGLASALLSGPELLLLDEPTNGLDPQGIRELRDLLHRLNDDGVTVVLSSHLLTEIEALCTDVAVLDRGRVAFAGAISALRPPTGRVVVHTPDAAAARALLGDRVVTHGSPEHGSPGLLVQTADPAALNAELVAHGIRVSALVPELRSLEDVVLGITHAGNDSFSPPGEDHEPVVSGTAT